MAAVFDDLRDVTYSPTPKSKIMPPSVEGTTIMRRLLVSDSGVGAPVGEAVGLIVGLNVAMAISKENVAMLALTSCGAPATSTTVDERRLAATSVTVTLISTSPVRSAVLYVIRAIWAFKPSKVPWATTLLQFEAATVGLHSGNETRAAPAVDAKRTLSLAEIVSSRTRLFESEESEIVMSCSPEASSKGVITLVLMSSGATLVCRAMSSFKLVTQMAFPTLGGERSPSITRATVTSTGQPTSGVASQPPMIFPPRKLVVNEV
mmetsp:Transcript_21519/g.40182  ORF Transcript_21519/g.40182 Transcript_21519/m.40182 type:complete len:263 (-) Transcript_21519:242-1030(-)